MYIDELSNSAMFSSGEVTIDKILATQILTFTTRDLGYQGFLTSTSVQFG